MKICVFTAMFYFGQQRKIYEPPWTRVFIASELGETAGKVENNRNICGKFCELHKRKKEVDAVEKQEFCNDSAAN